MVSTKRVRREQYAVNRVLDLPLERYIRAGAGGRLDEAEVTSVDLNVRSEHELQLRGRGRSGRRILSGGIDHGDENATTKYKTV